MPDVSYFSTESKLISEDDPTISLMERAMKGDNKKQEYTLEKCPGSMDTCFKTDWTIPGFPELSQKLCGKIDQFGGLEVPGIALNQDDCRNLSYDDNQRIKEKLQFDKALEILENIRRFKNDNFVSTERIAKLNKMINALKGLHLNEVCTCSTDTCNGGTRNDTSGIYLAIAGFIFMKIYPFLRIFVFNNSHRQVTCFGTHIVS